MSSGGVRICGSSYPVKRLEITADRGNSIAILVISLLDGFSVQQKFIHQKGVKVFSPLFPHKIKSLIQGPGLFVGTLTGEGIKNIRQADNPGTQGYCQGIQSSGITGAVPFFMVAFNDLHRRIQEVSGKIVLKIVVQCGQYGRSHGNMGFHDGPLLTIQGAWFEKYSVWYANFSQIME